MRNFLFVLLAFVCLVTAARAGAAPGANLMARQLRLQQKYELRTMRAQHRMQLRQMKLQHVDPAMRAVEKHRMQREERALRQRQKDQRQDLKDQIRLAKSNRTRYGV